MIPELPGLSRDDKIKIERLYNTGSYKAANIYLKNLARDNEEIKEYLRKLKKSQDIKNQTIITTHQKLLSYKDFNDTVIIDEDIILNAMFPMDKMLIGEFALIYAKIAGVSKIDAAKKTVLNILNEINNAPEGIIQETPSYFMLFAKEIEDIIVNDSGIKTNVLGFLNSSCYVKLKVIKIQNIYFLLINVICH